MDTMSGRRGKYAGTFHMLGVQEHRENAKMSKE